MKSLYAIRVWFGNGECVEDPIIPLILNFSFFFLFFAFPYQRCSLAISGNSLSNVLYVMIVGDTESNYSFWDMDNALYCGNESRIMPNCLAVYACPTNTIPVHDK